MTTAPLKSAFRIVKSHRINEFEERVNLTCSTINEAGGDVLSINYHFESATHIVGIHYQVPSSKHGEVVSALREII
jgi:hypothetical protein